MSGTWACFWNDGADLWADGMLRACWQGTLFILAIGLICRLFPRLPAAARCWLWWLASLKLMISLTSPAPLAVPLLRSVPAVAPAASARIVTPATAVPVTPNGPQAVAPAGMITRQRAAGGGLERPSLTPAGLLMALWLAGLFWSLGRTRCQWRAVRQLLQGARPVAEAEIRASAARLAAALRLRRLPVLLESPAAPGPLVVGLFRPAILLPSDAAARLSVEELRMALAHELAHVRRGDLWWSLAPQLARWLLFFNPLAALACREWMTAREAACDTAALRATGARPADYGRLLLKLTARSHGPALPALGATAGFELLKRRLTMLHHRSLSRRAWVGLIGLIGVGVLAALPWRLTARAASSPLAAAISEQEAQLAACERQLATIGRAMAEYRRDHGEPPAHLSDLFPKYVTDLKLLHCPADRTDGSARRSDDYADETAPPVDPRPVSYAYTMSPVKLRVRFGGLGGPLPRGADESWRGQMMAMRANYGDRVPAVRCWHHAKTMYEAASHPLVPSLTLDGALYRSAANWQSDPGTLALVVERMESDLAQGAVVFLQRWNLGAIAGQFGFAKPTPALANRARALAATLQGMAAQLSPHDTVTHLATDLPAAVGSLYAAAGDTDKAIAGYQEAINHLDQTVPYYHGGEITAARCLPALYAAKGQHEKAIAVYQCILLKDPEKSDWYISMASEYEAMGDIRTAVALRQKWDPSGQLLNKPAPVLSGCDEDGHSIDLPKLRGQVVVLFFRNSRYPRQDVVMRELDTLQRRYAGQGLKVVCLARLVDMGMAAEQAPKGHAYPLLLGAEPIYARYGVGDSSMLYIVDQKGKLVQRYLGYGYDPGEERWLEREVQKLLAPQMAERAAGEVTLAHFSRTSQTRKRRVLVHARVLEINKQRAQVLGIDWGAAAPDERGLAIGHPFLLGEGAGNAGPRPLDPAGVAVRALERQNALHILSDSSLLMREGEKGGMHLGGEIPIPSKRRGKAVSVVYRPFGILLELGALRIDLDMITLSLHPEVSVLDPARSVHQDGASVPGLRSQRTEVVVRLRPGDSFAIGGGLLREQGKQNPVLAELRKSRGFQNGESELIILLTPELKEAS